MKILIIGGTHFIGPYVVKQFVQQGHQVTIFHRGQTPALLPDTVQEILGDRAHLQDFKQDFQTLAPDVVLDLCAYTESDAKTIVETITGLTARIVVISSQDVYRARDIIWQREAGLDPVPLTEASALRTQLYPFRDMPEALGDISPDYEKILVEQVTQNASELSSTILRLPMVYGPGDYRHRLYPYLRRMDEGRPAIVLEAGMAQWRGSYGYVENVADAIALAVTEDRASGHIFNISESSPLSQADLIRLMGRQAGWNGRVVEVPTAQMPSSWPKIFNTAQDWVTDSNRIRQVLGFTERIPRDEALRRTIDWERHLSPHIHFQEAPDLMDYPTEDTLLASMTEYAQ